MLEANNVYPNLTDETLKVKIDEQIDEQIDSIAVSPSYSVASDLNLNETGNFSFSTSIDHLTSDQIRAIIPIDLLSELDYEFIDYITGNDEDRNDFELSGSNFTRPSEEYTEYWQELEIRRQLRQICATRRFDLRPPESQSDSRFKY